MILALLLLAAAAPAGDPCHALPAGPAEGMCIDEDAPKTPGMARLLPASHGGAPIPAKLAPLIAVALAAYDAGVPIPAGARTADATDRFCARFATDCPGPVRLAGWQLPAWPPTRPICSGTDASASNGCAVARWSISR